MPKESITLLKATLVTVCTSCRCLEPPLSSGCNSIVVSSDSQDVRIGDMMCVAATAQLGALMGRKTVEAFPQHHVSHMLLAVLSAESANPGSMQHLADLADLAHSASLHSREGSQTLYGHKQRHTATKAHTIRVGSQS